jgi:hypothetical protein
MWNGSSWSALGSGIHGFVLACAASGSNLYVGGGFGTAGGIPASNIAKWDGQGWSALGSGLDGDVFCITVNGSVLYAGGDFEGAGGSPAGYIAAWDGSSWATFGSGFDNAVDGIAVVGGDVYAGGEFTTAGEKPSLYFAKYLAPMTVTSPNGGEVWEAASGQTITWTGTAAAVKIEYSADNGATWTTLVGSMANTGSLYGMVPNTPSSQCLVRVTDTADVNRSDTSNATFTIAGFVITSPNGGEQWIEGSFQTITWTTYGTIPNVMLLFSADGGTGWSYITEETENTGSYQWTVPYNPQTQCLIRIRDASDNNPSDTSDAVFSILPAPWIIIDFPFNGEFWQAGTTHDIVWTALGLTGPVTIDLYKGWVFQKTLGTPDVLAGTLSWAISSSEPPGTDYAVVVWQGGVSDASEFSITAPAVRQEDLLATWDGQGVYYRNSETGAFVKLASPATMIATGDLDGDGIDDLIGLWPTQGGIWVKYSQSGAWAKLSSTAVHIAAGDMNGDDREDLLGTWDGQGVYYRNSISGAWVKLASPATLITTGDIDGDGTDDLVGIWPTQGGVWVKYSSTGAWAKLSSTARDIATGDMNGDGRDDLLATWDGQGVYYRNSVSGVWVKMASEATQVACGDLDADGTADLIGIWPTQGGVWVKYSETGAWAKISSTAADITAGVMRATGGSALASAEKRTEDALGAAPELPLPMGGVAEGPVLSSKKLDFSDRGPGGARFVFFEDRDLEPREDASVRLTCIPGPGESGFIPEIQKNIHPGEILQEKEGRGTKKEPAKIKK